MITSTLSLPFESVPCSAEELEADNDNDKRKSKRTAHAHSITFIPAYHSISFEELRFNDIRITNQAKIVSVEYRIFLPDVGLQTCRASGRKNVYGSQMITFRVGGDETRDFAIHEGVVCTASDFVALTMKPGWEESKQRWITLPDDRPEVFEIYQQWLYGGKICTARTPDLDIDDGEYQLLADAYIFGDKFLDVHFKDAIIDCIIDKLITTKLFDFGMIKAVYSRTLPSSPLRRLLLDIFEEHRELGWVEKLQADDVAQAEFMKDLLKLNEAKPYKHRGFGETAPFFTDSCPYHEHVKGICYKAQSQTTTAALPTKPCRPGYCHHSDPLDARTTRATPELQVEE